MQPPSSHEVSKVLKSRGREFVNFNYFPGDKAHEMTPEQIADMVEKAIDDPNAQMMSSSGRADTFEQALQRLAEYIDNPDYNITIKREIGKSIIYSADHRDWKDI
jgi:hypothetical protein